MPGEQTEPLDVYLDMLLENGLPHGLIPLVRDSFLDCFEGQQIYVSGKQRRKDRDTTMMERFNNGEELQRLCLEYGISRSRFRYIHRMSQRKKRDHGKITAG